MLKRINLSTTQLLFLFFVLGLILRFTYFPNNIYFGFDQARDAFISREVLNGHFKIIGPSTSSPGLYHGSLFYYLFAPIYWIGQGSPVFLSIFLRTVNASGIFLIFLVAKFLFDKKIGLLAAFLYAVSYEQSQYAVFMTHPALGIISFLLFYLGFAALFFKQKQWGLIVGLVGLGLSVQFNFAFIYLTLALVAFIIIFHKSFLKVSLKTGLLAIAAFACSILTFILAEFKFGFRTTSLLFQQVSTMISSLSQLGNHHKESSIGGVNGAMDEAIRFITDNLILQHELALLVFFLFIPVIVIYLRKKEFRSKIIFLLIWFVTGLFPYFIGQTNIYFYAGGSSISLLILTAFLFLQIKPKYKLIPVILVAIITISNIQLILINNKIGPNNQINVQSGMLLSDEEKVIDYVYNKAEGQPFAVNALSMPVYINTTWSYLFEWYGQKKYSYLPVWGGKAATGYPGNLTINNSRSTLPNKRFLIIEPLRGIYPHIIEGFKTEEGYFSDIIEQKQFGDFVVEYQKPK